MSRQIDVHNNNLLLLNTCILLVHGVHKSHTPAQNSSFRNQLTVLVSRRRKNQTVQLQNYSFGTRIMTRIMGREIARGDREGRLQLETYSSVPCEYWPVRAR